MNISGEDIIRFDEVEIAIGNGAVAVIDAEATVYWSVKHGDLTWHIVDWTTPNGVPFFRDLESHFRARLGSYVYSSKRDYIASVIVERNGLVLQSENAEHALSQRELI